VKMDIEGGESIILEHVAPFLAERRIPLCVSMHESWWTRPVDRHWFRGVSSVDGDLSGWNDVLELP